MRCCAYVLNLVVNDGLSVIENTIDIIHDSITYSSMTPSSVERLEEVAHTLKLSYPKKLSLDCITQWNSTYIMLQTTIEYKPY